MNDQLKRQLIMFDVETQHIHFCVTVSRLAADTSDCQLFISHSPTLWFLTAYK